MRCNNTNTNFRFLIDTGADISIIKIGDFNNISKQGIATITGITTESIQCLGSKQINLEISNEIIEHTFHIVEDDFPITTDGILRRDILAKYMCKIDFETFTITFTVNGRDITIPMNSRPIQKTDIILPSRSESIIPLNLKVDEDSIVLNMEVTKGVYLGNTIIPAKGIAHVKVLNTRDEDVTLKHLDCKMHPLKNYEIYKNDNTNCTDENRLKVLLETINIDGKDNDANESLKQIFKEYQDIFHLPFEKLSVNNFYTQEIQTTDSTPVYIKNYRLPQTQIKEINEQVDKLMADNIIEHSVSPYNSPLLVVPKKSANDEKKWRLVVDFRKLNDKIVNDKFPLTRIEDVLDRLGRARYFSTLDMTSSFHQINLHENSRPLTSFSTGSGHYQFKRLPFGLKISSNSFQRMLTIALSGLDAESFLYVDDIIVFGRGLKQHNENLVKVFKRLRNYNLRLNASKCRFLKSEVVYLGHLITDKGITTDPAKDKVIKEYPVPKTVDEVRRFVAFCNYYRRFVKGFADIAKNLNSLLKKNATFEWNEKCQDSFDTLREKLINPPILQYPDFDKTFILTTDASNYALGAVLSQGKVGTDLPISYASKSLAKHDLNKPIIEKELLAIHWGITFFRPYLYGRKFIVITDHRPLVSLFSHKNPSSKMTRIRLDLCDYDFEIIYKKGKMNTNADALSRITLNSEVLKSMIPARKDTDEKILAITRSMNKKQINTDTDIDKNNVSGQKTDQLFVWNCTSLSDLRNMKKLKFIPEQKLRKITFDTNDKEIIARYSDNPSNTSLLLEKLISKMHKLKINELALKNNDEIFKTVATEEFKTIFNKLQIERNTNLKIILYDEPKRIICQDTQQRLIEEYHYSTHGGHLGVRKTTLKLKQRYIWKNMSKMVKDYVLNCRQCRLNKQTKHTKERLILTDTPKTSFETLSIDTVGPIRLSNYYRYILTIQCELSKYVVACPMETKDAKTVAKTLVESFILKYGHFKILKSDKGTEFTNQLMSEICKLLDIRQIFSAPYHHETLGSIERNHRVLNEFLLNFCKDDQWDIWIPYFTFAYNTTPHVETGYTPYELIFGKLPYLPNDQLSTNNKLYNPDDYVNELHARLKFSLQNARKYLEKSKSLRIQNEIYVNPLNIKIGDFVLIKTMNRKKYQAPYHGPYKVVDIEGVNTIVNLGNMHKKYHNNMLKKWIE